MYNRIGVKWKKTTIIEKKIKEGTLAKIVPELTAKKMTTFLEKYRNRFVPKCRAFMILKIKVEDVV